MKQFKRTQVIMLPTKDILASNIGLKWTKEGTLLLLNDNMITKVIDSNKSIPQHLYIISDDEIKEGDWFIYYTHKDGNVLKQCKEIKNDIILCIDNQLISLELNNRKIIATTSTILCQTSRREIPQPSQQFIKKYIESYNKGNVGSNNFTITDILVEYEYCFKGENISRETTLGKLIELKVNLKDNTITIKKLKDSWNREEVTALIYKHTEDILKQRISIETWIEQNL